MASSAAAAPTLAADATADAAPVLTPLDTLPPWALVCVLSSPALALEDVARVACVSRPLRAAAADVAPARWQRVRVAGKTLLPLHANIFKARARGSSREARERLHARPHPPSRDAGPV
jgi:hypothetical protein